VSHILYIQAPIGLILGVLDFLGKLSRVFKHSCNMDPQIYQLLQSQWGDDTASGGVDDKIDPRLHGREGVWGH
jgi:hypothetical protein